MKIKIPDKKALELLEELPLEEVSNERNFLAPVLTTGRQASVLCDDVNFGQRLVAGELGTDNVWWRFEMENGRVRVTGTVNDTAAPVKVMA